MSLLIVGSVALDTVETPAGKVEDALGGAAVYGSVAASIFTQVNLVGVTGEDFPSRHVDMLRRRSIDLQGLQTVAGKTFRWSGAYAGDMNEAETRDTQLNVFQDFNPQLPEPYRQSETVFLANIHPALQTSVLDQVTAPRLVAMDTMNLWINTTRAELEAVLKRVDLLLMNDGEARIFTGRPGVVAAGRTLVAAGLRWVVVKKGEHGAMLFHDANVFAASSYPLERVVDPTGAGDTFAGAMLGYLDAAGTVDEAHLRRAILYGTAVASFNVEDFSLNRLAAVTREDVEQRYQELVRMMSLD